MPKHSPEDIQQHIAAMRRDIERMTRAVNRIAQEGARARAAMAKTATRASKAARVSGDAALGEAINLGADAGKATLGIIGRGAEAVRRKMSNPISALLVLSAMTLLWRRLFRR